MSKKDIRDLLGAVLAGLMIGVGGTVFLSCENKVAGALLFTVGLYVICTQGLNLYTGKVGYAVQQPAAYLGTLGIIWLGNLVGTGLAGIAVRVSRIRGICDMAASLCAAKL